jgi:hypothetical protein
MQQPNNPPQNGDKQLNTFLGQPSLCCNNIPMNSAASAKQQLKPKQHNTQTHDAITTR